MMNGNRIIEEAVMKRIETVQETFIRRYKPIFGDKVILESGEVVTSESVLNVVNEIKQFIKNGNIYGFWDFMQSANRKILNGDESRILFNTKITNGCKQSDNKFPFCYLHYN